MTRRKLVSQSQSYRIMTRDRWTCQYCGDHATEIDHVVPWSYIENNKDSNLVASCGPCNRKASNKGFDSFEEKKRYILIKRFNPRGKLSKD